MISKQLIPILTAIGIGVGTGVYVFQPLLKEYQEETHGTWMRPGDEERVKAWKNRHNNSEKAEEEKKQYPISNS